MNVTNNVNQLAALYSAALETSGIENAAVTPSEDGKSLTVTMQGAGGAVASTSTVAVPEIEVPTDGTVGDSVQLTNFAKNLSDPVKSLVQLDDASFDKVDQNVKAGLEKTAADSETAQAASTSGTSSTAKTSALYCIFRLMSLLLDVAREQREIARETREADTQMMLSTMESQRQAMIDEAITGLVCTCCVAAMQLGMMAVSAVKESSVSKAQKEAKTITGEETYNNVQEMSTKAGHSNALADVKQTAAEKLDAAYHELNPTDVNKSAAAEIDAQFKGIDNRTVLAKDVNNISNEKIPDPTPEELIDDKAQSRTEVYEQCKAERDKVALEYEAAAEKGNVPEKLQQKMKLANAKVEYAAACKLAAEAKPGNAPSSEKTAEFKRLVKADASQAERETGMKLTDKIAKKQLSATRTEKIGTILTQLFKGLTDQGLELMKAENKKYDQTVTLEKEKLDTTKDLVQNALEMFKQMLNVLSSINQAEKESFREIMG